MGIEGIKHWLHHLFNPHCDICAEIENERVINQRYCASCETLKAANAILRAQNEQLMDRLLNPSKPIEEVREVKDWKPVRTMPLPWNQKAAQLEKRDRELAESRRKTAAANGVSTPIQTKSQIIEENAVDLEKELRDVSDA